MYVLKEKDPAVHALKLLGYAFGDHLTMATHPVLYSRQ